MKKQGQGAARFGVLAIGTELLGRVPERNARWLGNELHDVGMELVAILVVRDDEAEIDRGLRFLLDTCDVVVTSGGTGTTKDDLTREVIATVAQRPLVVDRELLREVSARMLDNRWGNPRFAPDALAAGAAKQARIVEGAIPLDPLGTAAGMVVEGVSGDGVVVMLPGPRDEFEGMWRAALETAPLRALRTASRPRVRRTLRLCGVLESEFALTWLAQATEGLDVSACWTFGEGEVVVDFASDDEPAYRRFEAAVLARHGDAVFSRDGATVGDILAGLLRGRVVAVADACTGGILSARLTAIAEASEFLLRGGTANGADAMERIVGIPRRVLTEHGPVSREVALAAAEAARADFEADVAIAVTALAHPGAEPDRRVWTACLCVAGSDGRVMDRQVRLLESSEDIRRRVTVDALHLLRRYLLDPAR